MHFTTEDGYRFSTQLDNLGECVWKDAQVEIRIKRTHGWDHVLTLALINDRWIDHADSKTLDRVLGEGAHDELHRANTRRLIDSPNSHYREVEFNGSTLSMQYRFEDFSMEHMCDTRTGDAFFGRFADDNLIDFAEVTEGDNPSIDCNQITIHWNDNRCCGSEIVARFYPDFNCNSEAIFDECDGWLSATFTRYSPEDLAINRLAIAVLIAADLEQML